MEYFFPEGKSFSRICACSEDTKCHETMHLAQSLRLLFLLFFNYFLFFYS